MDQKRRADHHQINPSSGSDHSFVVKRERGYKTVKEFLEKLHTFVLKNNDYFCDFIGQGGIRFNESKLGGLKFLFDTKNERVQGLSKSYSAFLKRLRAYNMLEKQGDKWTFRNTHFKQVNSNLEAMLKEKICHDDNGGDDDDADLLPLAPKTSNRVAAATPSIRVAAAAPSIRVAATTPSAAINLARQLQLKMESTERHLSKSRQEQTLAAEDFKSSKDLLLQLDKKMPAQAGLPNAVIAQLIENMLHRGVKRWAPKVPVTKAVVDFSSSTIGMPMDVRNLRSVFIGDTIARFLKFADVQVLPVSHVFDSGYQLGGWIESLIESFPDWEDSDVQAIVDHFRSSNFFETSFSKLVRDSSFRSKASKANHMLRVKIWKICCLVLSPYI
ncbi:uncharacterized protein LOC113300283 [Papaver somniferum]|uniref:uncharacterized protein LOC113300283 n=1 Tax=Papaver somniferum TaxID=3469 RepID=UPI000E6FCE00|nr:uncharacterized protein LOC113300283 [Papaver somniferum]